MVELTNMTRINNTEEKEKFFKDNITGAGSYAIIAHDSGKTESVWITRYQNWNEDGSDWFLESPNILRKYDYRAINTVAGIKKAIKDIYDGYDYNDDGRKRALDEIMALVTDGIFFDIDSPQTPPFLPEKFSIKLISEEECIEWLKTHRK